jgi:hypothetical protein
MLFTCRLAADSLASRVAAIDSRSLEALVPGRTNATLLLHGAITAAFDVAQVVLQVVVSN